MSRLCEGGNDPAGSLKAILKCFVWSVALYGAETWTLRRNEEKRMEAFEIYSASSYDERVMERRKILPAPGLEPGFSALRADALSTKPHRIQPRRRTELSPIEFQLLGSLRRMNPKSKLSHSLTSLAGSDGISLKSYAVMPHFDKVLKLITKVPDIPTATLELVYGSVVRSSMLYGAEIWGWENAGKLNKVQTDFLKRILGIGRSTANCGVLKEFGLQNEAEYSRLFGELRARPAGEGARGGGADVTKTERGK
ncbi:hypothetical protein ANN_15948 [Periplaneta americana]|uniref:HhH-GPD domain-containing protein n=1 Tax=Periplaneta americana TaxID=6978 RepID=A0ABQ8SHV4_PERAM|nr:hypothetical protein ANN_15948 [Periplaneta americana]